MKKDRTERACLYGRYMVQNGATVRETAHFFGTSKSTVHKLVTGRLKQIDPALYGRVRLCWTPIRPSAISGAVRPPKRSICMNGSDSYLSVQATQAAYTRRAPAFFNTLAHSLRVEPVVTTSSIRTMDRPLHSGAA